MSDERVAGTLFIDMKYVFLYHKLGYKETDEDVYVKGYPGCTVTIRSEDQEFDFEGKAYSLKEHRDFVILELMDLLLDRGYSPSALKITGRGLRIAKGPKVRCERWGKDYEAAAAGPVADGEAVYTSQLSGGMIDRLYVFGYKGKRYTRGLFEEGIGPYEFAPSNPPKEGKYPEQFIVKDRCLVSYAGTDEDVEVPDGITKIGTGAFWNNVTVRSITLPESVEKIAGDAFVYCYNLERTAIPEKVCDIGDDPFAGCPKLVLENRSPRFVLDNGILFTADRTRLIHYTPSLEAEEYVIPDSVEWVGKHSFYNCNNLRKVVIGRNVDYVGNNPFSDCHHITLENLSPHFAYEDGALMNSARTTIYHYSHGRDADEYVMPDTVRTVGRNSFWNCHRIRRVVIGPNVRQIGYNPFANCVNLEIVSESPAYRVVDGILYDSSVRESVCCTDWRARMSPVSLPKTVENIGRNSFAGCTSLRAVTIPDSVKSISRGAFSHCESLREVYIPDSVEIVEKWAFGYCTSLRKVSAAEGTDIHREAFIGSDKVELVRR